MLSAAHATTRVASLWPASSRSSVAVAASNTVTLPVASPAARSLPSERNVPQYAMSRNFDALLGLGSACAGTPIALPIPRKIEIAIELLTASVRGAAGENSTCVHGALKVSTMGHLSFFQYRDCERESARALFTSDGALRARDDARPVHRTPQLSARSQRSAVGAARARACGIRPCPARARVGGGGAPPRRVSHNR